MKKATVTTSMEAIFSIIFSADPLTAEQLGRLEAHNAVLLTISIMLAVAVQVWMWGGFFVRRWQRRAAKR